MASSSYSSSSAEDKVDGLGGLLNLIGIVPARARFVGGAVASSLLSSLTIGLSFGMVGAAFLPTGPLIPFLMGSGIGHSFGLYHYYRSHKNDAMRIARNYPSILAHALWTEWGVVVPSRVVIATEEQCRRHHGMIDASVAASVSNRDSASMLDRWIENKGCKMVGFTILALPECRSDVEEIQRHQREAIVHQYQETSEKVAGPSCRISAQMGIEMEPRNDEILRKQVTQ